jgi:tetratricopeptide (TPR) repeat protein
VFEPQDAREAYNRGLEYLDYNEPDQAIAAFNEAVRLSPRHIHALFARGCAWAERGDLAKAIADYEATLQLDPNYTAAHANLAEAQRHLKSSTNRRNNELVEDGGDFSDLSRSDTYSSRSAVMARKIPPARNG